MKKRTIMKCSGLFIMLFVFFLSYVGLDSSMRFRPEQVNYVMIQFKSSEKDWFDFFLRVEYSGKLEIFNISQNDEDNDRISIQLEESFKDPTSCFLLCRFNNYNLTIAKRDLMSDKAETLYENEGKSVKWIPIVMVVN